jgi:hypothetical protein
MNPGIFSGGLPCDVRFLIVVGRRPARLPVSFFCRAGICQYFEEKLKRENPHTKKITYDIADLFAFIDSLADLATLTFDNKLAAYVPHNKQWIKGHSHTLRDAQPNKRSCYRLSCKALQRSRVLLACVGVCRSVSCPQTACWPICESKPASELRPALATPPALLCLCVLPLSPQAAFSNDCSCFF